MSQGIWIDIEDWYEDDGSSDESAWAPSELPENAIDSGYPADPGDY
jgi:hypothetical protein